MPLCATSAGANALPASGCMSPPHPVSALSRREERMKRFTQRWRKSSRLAAFTSALVGGAVLALLLSSGPVLAQSPITINVAPPELVGGPWLNTPENAPISLESRHGKVTILHFWTF